VRVPATYLPDCMGRVWQVVWIGAGYVCHTLVCIHQHNLACIWSMTGCVCICNNVTHTRKCPPPSAEDIIITTCVTWYAAERRSLGVICSLAVRVRREKAAEQKKTTGPTCCTSCGAVVSGSKQPWMCGSARCQSLTPPHALSALLISRPDPNMCPTYLLHSDCQNSLIVATGQLGDMNSVDCCCYLLCVFVFCCSRPLGGGLAQQAPRPCAMPVVCVT
jgi:hypothetical protein